MKRVVATLWVLSACLCAGCGAGDDALLGAGAGRPGPSIPADAALTSVAYTFNGAGGNRLVEGRGAVPDGTVVDIPLGAQPRWLLSGPRSNGESVWVSVLDDGRVVGYAVSGAQVSPVTVTPDKIDPTGQPALALDSEGAAYLINVVGSHAPAVGTTAAVNLGTKALTYINNVGDLVVLRDGEESSLAVKALPNTRILVDDQERVLLLCEPSDRYSHDVLGGNSTANSAVLVATRPILQVITKFSIPAPKVIEGNALIWADLTGDAQREVVLTVSDGSVGSALQVYDEQGALLASSAAIGTGFRWHHQLAVAPFMSGDRLELAVTRTPHIGGVTEFYRLEGDELVVDSARLGYTSHSQGVAFNIDMALAGDFDGDSQIELLVPSEDFTRLGGIAHAGAGEVRREWEVAIGGRLTTNLSAVQSEDGRISVGAGHTNGALRIWH